MKEKIVGKKPKTLPVVVAECKSNIADAINGSGLPACITKMILTEFLNQLSAIEQQQLMAETNNIEREPKKEENQEGEED